MLTMKKTNVAHVASDPSNATGIRQNPAAIQSQG